MLYKQAMAAVGDNLGSNKGMLDPIWNFPLSWPPVIPKGDKSTEVDKDMLKESVDKSLMKGEEYATSISSEGGKIDLNDLGSDIPTLKKAMIAQVLKIFKEEIQNNDAFAEKYSNFRFEELVNNIADYVDEDKTSLNGGDESNAYHDLEEKDLEMPPNRPLRTLDELHQVAGMTDDFYNVLAPRVTVFGTKGINVNYASKDVIMALDPTITEDIADKILARRNDPKQGGPFKDEQDFFGFIAGFGVDTKAIEASKVPLLFDPEFNFRIESTGLAGNVKRDIIAVTYDYANLTTRLAKLMDAEDKQDQGGGGTGSANPPPTTPPATPVQKDANADKKTKIQGAKGRPDVVYWEEN
jgi:general secretion pathway protein K